MVQGPQNWDFRVFTHETGHNFGTLHTHDYCPPIDECSPYFGPCQTQQNCINYGTLMSYCHLCSGGLNNISPFFHPTVVTTMVAYANYCLPLFASIDVDPPLTVSNLAPTPVVATIHGAPTGTVSLFYRYDGGSYSSVAMTGGSGSDWIADLPPANCWDSPEFYIAYTDATCGPITEPDGAPGNVFGAAVDCTDVTSYCSTSPNSVGSGAQIGWAGSASVSAADLELIAWGCPSDQFGLYYYGAAQISVPFGEGIRCVGAGGVGTFRFSPFLTDMFGGAYMAIDYSSPPVNAGTGQWAPGTEWNLQWWYRDPTGGPSQFNLSDALHIVFWP